MEQAYGGRRPADYEYRALMSSLQVSVSKHLLDAHYTVIWANDFYYRIIGYSKEEYEAVYHNQCDAYYRDHNAMDEYAKITQLVTGAVGRGETGYSMVTRMPRRDGGYTWVRLVGTFTNETVNGYPVSYTVFTDINDLVRTQREQSITYDNLPGFAAKFHLRADKSLELLSANKGFTAFFGDNWPTLVRRLDSPRQEKDALWAQLLKGEPVRLDAQLSGRDGKLSTFQISATCVDWQGGDPIYLVIYIDVTDVTVLRQMQARLQAQAQQLREALDLAEQASRAKSDFLSRMSHDIRTPLNAIMGMTEIAASHLAEPDKLSDCLKKITLSSKHLLGLINDVLDMSKIESGKMAPNYDSMSLPEVLENVVAIVQPMLQSRDLRFSIRLHSIEHEQLICDALRLRQVFINILSNAVKFTPEGGRVTLDVREEPSARPGYGQFTFLFGDTGIGMRPEFLAHIFDAFSRERDSRVDKAEGTGLGMAITQKIVSMLGGDIQVQSTVGVGSTFTIRLPIQLDQMQPQEEKLSGLRVLVVDDDEVLCRCAVDALAELNVCAQWTNDGRQAISWIEDAHRRGEDYHAVILDWKMPGMSGLNIAKAIREKAELNISILIISAYDWSQIEEAARSVGVNGFLSKPLFRSTLSRGLQRYVLGHGETPSGSVTAGAATLRGIRLLLVEDNALNQEIAVELLSSLGAQVDCADDGAQGVAQFAASPVGHYSLILMDVQMPALNGYDATRRIRALPRPDAQLPILAMTADAFTEDIAAAKAAGMNGHMAKPLELNTMVREIRRVLPPPANP